MNGRTNYSKETKCAILRAVFHVINADNKTTEEENKYFINLAMKYDNDPSIIDYALKTMNDDEMLRLLDDVPLKELGEILENAAKADGEISITEMKTIIGIETSTPSAKQEMDKYDTLLRKYGIF
ncbi:MAG: hypothetical protein LUH50_19400 [Bacteroides intestinalis]|nr:hypothetical protein [Bacteroides intestinalis]